MLAILLILIFIRPFICSLAFIHLNIIYSTILLGFLIIWLIYKGIPLDKINNLKFPLMVFVLSLGISIIFSTDKIYSLRELYKYISGILIFLSVISLTYEGRVRVIKTIVLAGFLISLLAIYQYFFGFRYTLEYIARHKIQLPTTVDYIQNQRVYFPFVTPNALGGYLIIIIPLALTLWSKKKNILSNLIFFIVISLSLALLLTKSLGALLSIFLGLIIYSYLQGGLNKKRLALIAGVLIIIGLVFIMRQTATKQYTLPTFSLTMRLNYWLDSLKIIKTAPFAGIGLGNFNLIFARYAHNSYLQIWAEMGILGIVSFLWLIISILKSCLKNLKRSPYKTQTAGLLTANIVFLIHNFVDFGFYLPEIALIWWVIIGLLYSQATDKITGYRYTQS